MSLAKAIQEAFATNYKDVDAKEGTFTILCEPSKVEDIVDELAVEFPKGQATILKAKRAGKSVIEFVHSADYDSVINLDKLVKQFDAKLSKKLK